MAADKKAAKKPAAKKAAPKAAAKAAPKAAAKKAVKPTPVTSRWNKTQIMDEISARVGIARKQASAAIEELGSIIARHISKNGPGEFVLPGLLKVNTRKKPAQPKRKGIDPFTKQERIFAAKPASTTVKVRPLKKMKDMVKK